MMTKRKYQFRRKPEFPAKAPKITEKEITRAIRAYLSVFEVFHFKVWQGLGSAKGVADIIGIYKGYPIAIEVKAHKGKLSEHQNKFLLLWQQAGGVSIVARSVDDVINALSLVSPAGETPLSDRYNPPSVA